MLSATIFLLLVFICPEKTDSFHLPPKFSSRYLTTERATFGHSLPIYHPCIFGDRRVTLLSSSKSDGTGVGDEEPKLILDQRELAPHEALLAAQQTWGVIAKKRNEEAKVKFYEEKAEEEARMDAKEKARQDGFKEVEEGKEYGPGDLVEGALGGGVLDENLWEGSKGENSELMLGGVDSDSDRLLLFPDDEGINGSGGLIL